MISTPFASSKSRKEVGESTRMHRSVSSTVEAREVYATSLRDALLAGELVEFESGLCVT